MSVLDFIRQRSNRPQSIVTDGLAEVHRRVDDTDRQRPAHVPDQRERIRALFDTEETVWLLFFDAGRFDLFDQLVGDYFEGELSRVYNGGIGYTGDWAVRHLTDDFGNRGLFSWVPLRGFGAADYDGREHFAVSPDIQPETAVHEQLAALGYAEHQEEGGDRPHVSPEFVNESVRHHKHRLDGGVVRYLKPHPPFAGLDGLTSESTKTRKTRDALAAGDLSHADLADAYVDTYRIAFRHAHELVADLDGRVVITADHGSCLGDCGQLFHGRRLEMHDHLTVVPWFEVDGLA